jgi:hypothetical protein
VLVSLGSDGAAAVMAACLAADLARQADQVLLVDLTSTSALAAVLDVAHGPPKTVVLPDVERPVDVLFPSWTPKTAMGGDGVDVERLELHDSADVVIVVATLDPAIGADHLAEWSRTAVALVTAGRSTATALRSTARMVAMAGIDLDSAVLLDTDGDDETVGLGGRQRTPPTHEDQAPWVST